MKKLFLPLRSALLLLLLLGTVPFAYGFYDKTDMFYYQGIRYQITDEHTVAVAYDYSYQWGLGDVVIPPSISILVSNYGEDYNLHFVVTAIEEGAFRNCSRLKTIQLPNTVKTIGSSAFYGCSGLTSVTLPSGLESIEGSAFGNCTSLQSVTIPNTVTSLEWNAFYGCSSLTDVTLSNHLRELNGTFIGCSSLQSVIIPASVVSLNGTFTNCTSLNSVIVPSSVSKIGEKAFMGCSGLVSVYIPNSVTQIGQQAFSNTGLKTLVIPNTVTAIAQNAFQGCNQLTSVTSRAVEPPAMSSQNTFDAWVYQNANLKVPLIAESTYRERDWWNLFTDITGSQELDNAYDFVSGGIYYNKLDDTNVEVTYKNNNYNSYSGSVTIPASVTHQGKTYSVTAIGNFAFYHCSALTSVSLPATVTAIGHDAFTQSGLTAVNLPAALTTIATRAFYGCSNLSTLTIPQNVKSIGQEAFTDCSGLTKLIWNAKHCWSNGDITTTNLNNVTIGNGVEVLPVGFVAQSKITTVNIPSSVIFIGSRAFDGCSSLTNLTIPSSVSTIGLDAFADCAGLTALTWKAKDCNTNGNMCTSNIAQVTIGNEVETIPVGFLKNSQVTTVNIPNSVKSIGAIAFSDCSRLANLSLSESTQDIGDFAFSGCTALTSLTIPRSVTAIGYDAFRDCNALTSLTWNAVSCTTNGDMTTQNLTQVTIGNEVKKLPIDFANGSKITSISIPNSVDSICSYAFAGCNSLSAVDIPNSVIHIGGSAFNECSGLTNLTIGSSVERINSFVFSGCTSLTNVVIPDNVTDIGYYAFYGCTGLTTLTLGASVAYIGSYAFADCSSLLKVLALPSIPPSLSYDAFRRVPGSMVVYVLPDALEAYQADYNWSSFNIEAGNPNVANLTVNLPDGIDLTKYANMKLEVAQKDSDQSLHYIIGNQSSYRFANLEKNTVWNVTLTNQYGDEFGRMNDVTIGEEDVTVTFPSLKQPQTVTLTAKTPDGQDVTSQVSISWLDEDGELLTQGKQISGLPAGRKLTYSIKLPQVLATAYTLPSNMTYTVKEGANNVLCQLTQIAQTHLSGKVKDAVTNQPLSGATISATQTFAGGNTKTVTTTTDRQGAYSLDALSAPTTLTVAARGYISQSLNCDDLMTGGNVTIPDVALSPITGTVVNINLTYTPTHAEGETAQTQNGYADYSNVDYEVYNKTTGHAITQISIQYPQIVLMEDVNDGDVLELTATSRKGAFMPVKTTVTVAEQLANATFNIKELGKVAATFNKNSNPKVTGTLYDADDKLVKTADYTENALTMDALPDGDYQLVTMGKSDFFNSIYDLDQFAAAGLAEGDDYVKHDVQVESGLISKATIDEVPFFDESKFYYTGEQTSFSVNKPSIVIGNYLTFRAQIDFKEQYANKVRDVQLIVDLPESCAFYENSVMVGATSGGYILQGNRMTIPLANWNDVAVRFCVIPIVHGDFAPSAFVRFKLNGKTIAQPIGSAPFTAQGLSISVPRTVADTRVTISGTAIGACEVDIFDNDVLIGHTTSLQNGTWSTQCELNNPFNLSTHCIHALVTTTQGMVLQTEIADCLYDTTAIEVDNVVMTFYNGWLRRNVSVVFDCLNGTVNPSSYQFYNDTEFTFVVNFTNNDTTILSYVVVNVFTDHNNIRRLPAVYDENSDCWVASAFFSSNDLPVNVSVDFSANSEQFFTSSHLNDILSETQCEYDEYVQGRNDIDEMLANAWTAIEDAGDNTDALLAAYDNFDDVISQINTIYNLGIDLQSSSEYDNLSEEELEATEEEDINRMLAFLQELEQEIENINKSYIYQEYSDFVDQQNGIAITSTTCDGLSPAYLLEHGYEAIPTDDGDSIYVKFGSDTVSYVNFEENICQTIILSEIVESMMFAATVLERSSSEESPELIEELKVIFHKIKQGKKHADQILATLGRATVNSIKDDYAEMLANCNSLVGTFKELSNLVSEFVDKAKDTKLFAPLKSLQEKYNRLHNEWSLAKAHAAKSNNINRHLFWKSIAARLEEQMPKSKFLMNSGKFLLRYAPVAAVAFAVADAAEKIATVVGAASTIFPCEEDPLNACRTMIYAIGIVRNIGHYVEANLAVEMALDGTALATSESVLIAAGFIVLKYAASWGVDKVTKWHFNSQMNALYNMIGALKCQKNPKPKPSDPKTPPTTPTHDPSGFVYEGVPSNRLQGVTATCYYKETVEDIYGDQHDEAVLWDAEQYGQQNPLLTDENGYYRWDVPVGLWQVKYEKEGYETTYSDWLPVPPPQLDVNIGMVQMRHPEVIKARAYTKAVEFEFDKYMFPETLTPQNIQVVDQWGETVSGTIDLLNAEVDDPLSITTVRRAPGTGLTFASKVRFNAYYPFYGNEVTLRVSKRVKSYADLEMSEDYVVTLPIENEMEMIEVDPTVMVPYGDNHQLTVTVTPATASKGKTLTVRTASPMIISTDAETYTLDNNGKAVVTVHGVLPGSSSLIYGIDGYDLSATTLVNVLMESQMTVATPTASIASGSEVEKGTAVYLSCSTPGATIYYTLDGSCPCDNTPALKVYDGSPIIINNTVTIKAMAIAPDLYDSDVASFVYRVAGGKKGDVNGDGEVNIADVNAAIGVILGSNTDGETVYRADVNSDGEVNIADINDIIRIILSPANMLSHRVNCNDRLHINDVTMKPEDVRTIQITVDHATSYSSMQCDIVLPDGLTLVSANATSGNMSKTGSVDELTSRVLTYSDTKTQFAQDSQNILTLTVRADAALATESEIKLTNAILSGADDKAWHVADCVARVNNASGIVDLTALNDRVWVEGNTLFIEARQDGTAQLAAINGVVTDIPFKAGINQQHLDSGIYIVVINGISHKIAIK